MSTPYELIAREVEARFRTEFEARIGDVLAEGRAALDSAVADATAHVDEAVTRIVLDAQVSNSETVPDAKADAKSRSWRTLVQGLIATVVVGVGGTLGTALVDPNFDIGDITDWKFAGASVGTAAVAAAIAYVQRFVQPPKGS